MIQLVVEYFNVLNKWMITHNVKFVGHEIGEYSIFSIVEINRFNCHIEVFYNFENNTYENTVINVYKNAKIELDYSGPTEECLKAIDELINN